MSPQFSETLVIPLKVEDKCATDVVTAVGTIASPIEYTIKDSPNAVTVSHSPTWSTSVPGCAVTHEIKRTDAAGGERALNTLEAAVISFDSANGKFSITTTDGSLDG